jgi:hypothetical protein
MAFKAIQNPFFFSTLLFLEVGKMAIRNKELEDFIKSKSL